jgi:hypothetical protein
MAISTETQALLDLYNQKISLDTQQLTQINTVETGYTITTGIGASEKIKIWGPTEVIENYNPPIQKLDTKIIEINDQINVLQQSILSVGQAANAVGCGTTGWFVGFTPIGFSTVTVLKDQLNYRGYTFTAPNPFSATGAGLTTGTIGLGTESYIAQPTLGVYYGPIGVDGICAGYATSITNLTNAIVGLRSERDPLIQKVNFLKTGRSQYELQNYGLKQSKVQVGVAISVSSAIIGFLQNPANAEWL